MEDGVLTDEEKFQSTHPHGVRRPRKKAYSLSRCFNPRTHTGCDILVTQYHSLDDRFNPRTHTGCDAMVSVTALVDTVSIHAPTRGATMRR